LRRLNTVIAERAVGVALAPLDFRTLQHDLFIANSRADTQSSDSSPPMNLARENSRTAPGLLAEAIGHQWRLGISREMSARITAMPPSRPPHNYFRPDQTMLPRVAGYLTRFRRVAKGNDHNLVSFLTAVSPTPGCLLKDFRSFIAS